MRQRYPLGDDGFKFVETMGVEQSDNKASFCTPLNLVQFSWLKKNLSLDT